MFIDCCLLCFILGILGKIYYMNGLISLKATCFSAYFYTYLMNYVAKRDRDRDQFQVGLHD